MTKLMRLGLKFAYVFRHLIARDKRSRRIVVVIECILNQNARDDGAAVSPAMNVAVVDLCRAYDVGILQIPCPEMDVLGFARTRPSGTSIKEALDTDLGRMSCREISRRVAGRVQGYIAQDYKVLAVLGGNPESPGCAVHPGQEGLLASSGVLMLELYNEFKTRNWTVPFRAMRDFDSSLLSEDLCWLEEVFRS